MLRALIGLVLLGIAGAIGFYYGRYLNPVPDPATDPEVSWATEPAAPSPAHPEPQTPAYEEQTRSRAMEMGEAGPPVSPLAPVGSPLGEPVAPPPPTELERPDAKAPSYTIGSPIKGLTTKDIQDTFNDTRGGGERRHEATDIMAPRGTPVLAVVDGIVKRMFKSIPGGLTVYQFDSAENYCFYYAHLDRYAEGLREGQLLRRGDVLGYVGTTGNSGPDNPHLHFAILQLGPEKKWWTDTTPVNPYPLLVEAVRKRPRQP